MNTKVIILDGALPLSKISDRAIQYASLVAVTNPKKRNSFAIIKARYLPSGWTVSRTFGQLTRKSLYQLIEANLD